MRRPKWLAIIIFIVGYKLGEAMAGVMAMPLYISIGFSLNEIAAVSKLVGFFATVIGAIIGGLVTSKLGVMRALILCGFCSQPATCFTCCKRWAAIDSTILRCASPPRISPARWRARRWSLSLRPMLARVHATQYALLSSLAAVGRTMVASSGGLLADRLGWVHFF